MSVFTLEEDNMFTLLILEMSLKFQICHLETLLVESDTDKT